MDQLKVGDELTYYWNYPSNSTSKIVKVETVTVYHVSDGDDTRRIWAIDGQLWKISRVNVDPINDGPN